MQRGRVTGRSAGPGIGYGTREKCGKQPRFCSFCGALLPRIWWQWEEGVSCEPCAVEFNQRLNSTAQPPAGGKDGVQ